MGELWHFKYFQTWRLSAILNFKKMLIFGHMIAIRFLICCCAPNFIKIGLRARPPEAHMHGCRYHGNRITGSLVGELQQI